MGINLEKMRAKLANLRGNGNDDNNFWRPSDGDQDIRIVPTPDGDPSRRCGSTTTLETTLAFYAPSATLAIRAPCAISLLSYGARV